MCFLEARRHFSIKTAFCEAVEVVIRSPGNHKSLFNPRPPDVIPTHEFHGPELWVLGERLILKNSLPEAQYFEMGKRIHYFI